MKHTKSMAVLLAMALATGLTVPTFAENENIISSSGSTGKTDVKLTVEAPTFNVTVPTQLLINVSATGKVTTASTAQIENNSFGAVKVKEVAVTAADGWTLVPFQTNMSEAKVDSKEIGLEINGVETIEDSNKAVTYTYLSGTTTNSDGTDPYPSIPGHTVKADQTGASEGETLYDPGVLAISYDAVVSPTSEKIDEANAEKTASVVFTIGWDTGDTVVEEKTGQDILFD